MSTTKSHNKTPPFLAKNSSKASLMKSSRSIVSAAFPEEAPEDVVGMMDVLGAMAESVVFTQSYFEVPFVPDRVTDTSQFQPRRPPREVFYRNTSLYITEIPPPAPPKRCNCQINCKPPGGLATYRCLSCGLFETTSAAFFCNECFLYTHPWHRASHIFTRLEADEVIADTMIVANRMAEVSRRALESDQMRLRMNRVRQTFELLGDDEAMEDKMRSVGRRSVALEERLGRMRRQLQEDIARDREVEEASRAQHIRAQEVLLQSWSVVETELKQKRLAEVEASSQLVFASSAAVPFRSFGEGDVHDEQPLHMHVLSHPPPSQPHLQSQSHTPLPLEPQTRPHEKHAETYAPPPRRKSSPKELAAALRVQSAYRGYRVRRSMSAYYLERTIRIFDPSSGRDYYFDQYTHASSWQPPVLLRRADKDLLVYRQGAPVVLKWYLKMGLGRRRPDVIDHRVRAAGVIQGFIRCALARRRLVCRAQEVYRRIYDEEYEVYFYWNTSTKRSEWQKPRLFLSSEPPLYVPDDDSCGSGSGSGRSTYHGSMATSQSSGNNSSRMHQKVDPRVNRERLAVVKM